MEEEEEEKEEKEEEEEEYHSDHFRCPEIQTAFHRMQPILFAFIAEDGGNPSAPPDHHARRQAHTEGKKAGRQACRHASRRKAVRQAGR